MKLRLLSLNALILLFSLSLNAQTAPDDDFDGVPNEEDRCPYIFGSKRTMGCPDADKDGIPDSEDKCPNEKGFANLLGCVDTDNDGVIDPEDECADVYGEGPMGCPIADENDLDGDGVENDLDNCPEVKGLFTAAGCPDLDGDGIKDEDDLCPNYFGLEAHQGCPIDKADLDKMNELVRARNKANSLQSNGYYVDESGNIFDRNENSLSLTNEGNIIDSYNRKLTVGGGYRVDGSGNLVNEVGLLVQLDPSNILKLVDGTVLNPMAANVEVQEKPQNPTNPTPNNFDNLTESGIVLGRIVSDAYPSQIVENFPDMKSLSPEEKEYCSRVNVEELKAAIYFEYDEERINSNSLTALNSVVEAMRKCAILELQIAGHTDSDGSSSYNLGLSERRAKAVMRYIQGEGISDRRLKYNAYGERYPLMPNSTEEGKKLNRRAEVHISRHE